MLTAGALYRPSSAPLWLALAAGACSGPPPSPPPPLRVALYSAPLTLDPHHSDEHLTQSVLSNVFEGLTAFGPQMAIEPALAESWTNPDDLTWQLVLRRDVSFHDGNPLTVVDVVSSLERARSLPASHVSGYLVSVARLRALDDRTIEIVTARPYPILLNKLARVMIVPAGSPETIVQPVGTGPYRLEEAPAGGTVRLAAFREHWRGAPETAELELAVVEDASERLNKLIAGEVDLALALPVAAAASLASQPCCEIIARPTLGVTYLQGRVDRPPLDDLRVRRAIHLAIDRRQLLKGALAGIGEAATQMVAPGVFGYERGLPLPEPDLQRARQLLTEAGYPDGIDLELEYRDSRAEDLSALVKQLSDVGIRVTLRPRPWAELYPLLRRGEVTFYFGGFLVSSGDASDLFDTRVHSPDAARGYGESAIAGYRNEELDRLIEESSLLLDMRLRRHALGRCMRLLMQDLPMIPLYVDSDYLGARKGIDWRPRADSRVLAVDLRRRPGAR